MSFGSTHQDSGGFRSRLNVEHPRRISDRVGLPRVPDGGPGIELGCVLEAVESELTKINVATAIRQPCDAALGIPRLAQLLD